MVFIREIAVVLSTQTCFQTRASVSWRLIVILASQPVASDSHSEQIDLLLENP